MFDYIRLLDLTCNVLGLVVCECLEIIYCIYEVKAVWNYIAYACILRIIKILQFCEKAYALSIKFLDNLRAVIRIEMDFGIFNSRDEIDESGDEFYIV
jgi:hypothetical protein